MSDKFLGCGGGSDISDGTALVYAASLGASNLDPSMPVKTNSTRQLVSTKLDIADVNNLQTSPNSMISNPYNGELTARSYAATQGNPNKRIRVTEDTITSDNRTVIDFSAADTIDLQATNVLVNGIVLPYAADVTALEQKTQYLTAAGGVTVFDSPLNMNSSKITGMADPTQPQDAATMAYVNKEVAAVVHPDQSLNKTDDVTFNSVTTSNINANGVETMKLNANQILVNAPIIFRGVVAPDIAGGRDIGVAPGPFRTVYAHKLTGLDTPTSATDATNRDYVDDQKGVTSVYTTITLPTAVGKTGQIVYVSNEGNMAFSNNTTWIRMINSAAGWAQPSMTSMTTPAPFVVTTNSTEGQWVPWKGFDGVLTGTGNWWHTVTGAFSAAGAYIGPATGKAGIPNQGTWLVLEMDRSIPIRKYQLYPRFDNTSGNAKSWHIIYSVDGVTYSVADTKVTQTMTPSTEYMICQLFAFPLVLSNRGYN